MKIMTFNIQHCASFLDGLKIDFPLFAKTIAESGADIVGLNEVRGRGVKESYQDQAAILSKLSGLSHHYFARAIMIGGENPYGNALLSRSEILHAETIPIPDPERRVAEWEKYYESRCILKAKLACGLTVAVVHMGLTPDELDLAIETLLANVEDEKFILMGDFNMVPENPRLATLRERLFDTSLLSSEVLPTAPSDKPTSKLDYIFTSRDLRVKSICVPEWIVSDHRPCIIEIE